MRADGSEFPAELTVTRTGLPEAPAFTGYVRNITDRRRAERELIASRVRLAAAPAALTGRLPVPVQPHLPGRKLPGQIRGERSFLLLRGANQRCQARPRQLRLCAMGNR